MNIEDYPYGKITKTLRKAVDWLNENQSELIEKFFPERIYFDYPHYWDMPKTISSRLTPDQVDWIQGETDEWFRKKQTAILANVARK